MFAQYVLVNRVASLKWVYVKRMSASKQAIERERERERQGRREKGEGARLNELKGVGGGIVSASVFPSIRHSTAAGGSSRRLHCGLKGGDSH